MRNFLNSLPVLGTLGGGGVICNSEHAVDVYRRPCWNAEKRKYIGCGLQRSYLKCVSASRMCFDFSLFFYRFTRVLIFARMLVLGTKGYLSIHCIQPWSCIYICLHDLGREEKKWATGNLDKIESCLLSGWQVEWSEDISVRWRIIMTTILLDFWRSLRRDVTCPSVSTVATSIWTRYPRESAVTVSQTPPLPLHPHTQLTRVIKFVLTEYCRFVL